MGEESRVFVYEVVPNTDRRFGSATEYIPVQVYVDPGADPLDGLLTWSQVAVAVRRGNRNPEDMPPKKKRWLERLLGWW